MDTIYQRYELQVMDRFSGKAVTAVGGKALVTAAGDTRIATLFDPISYAPLTNPLTLVRGTAAFAVVAGAPENCDIYVMAPGGQFLQIQGVGPMSGKVNPAWVDTQERDQTLVWPYDFNDMVGTTEKNTGLILPTNALIGSDGLATKVLVTEPAKTLSVGVLSTESGGDATAFINAFGVTAAAGVVTPVQAIITAGGTTNFVAATQTVGTKLKSFKVGTDTANTEGIFQALRYRIDGVAKTLSMTGNTWVAAKGWFYLPYKLA